MHHQDTKNTKPPTHPKKPRRHRAHRVHRNGAGPTPIANTKARRHKEFTKPPTRPNLPADQADDADGITPDFSVWRDSGRRTAGSAGPATAPNTSVRLSARPSGLRFGSAVLATSLLHSIVGICTNPLLTRERKGRTDVLLARRRVRGPTATDACIWSCGTHHRQQAVRSPGVLSSISETAFRAQRPLLCVLCGS